MRASAPMARNHHHAAVIRFRNGRLIHHALHIGSRLTQLPALAAVIAVNAGLEGAVIINKVRESEVGVGFDAYNEQYVNMVEAGILDPAKVTRTALQNATSVASTFLTTEACVANIKEPVPAAAPAGGGMGMM